MIVRSFRRIIALTLNTLTDLTRQRVFYFALVFALVLIASSVLMARFTFQQEFQILKDVSLGIMSLVTSLLAVIATARLIPQDLEDRTVYTILAKPVPRFEYLLGKLFGILLLLALSLLLMSALFVLVLYSREQSVLSETMRQMSTAPHDQMEAALRSVRGAAFNLNLVPAIATIYLKAVLLAALTLFVSTFASTHIFTVIVMVFVYLIGHLQGVAREYWLQSRAAGWFAQSFLALVALLFPDLQAFNLIDDAVVGTAIPLALFVKTAGLGFFYAIVYTSLGTIAFYGREL